MVFLESPAGVGFSTPELPLRNYTDDFTTARTYEFLQQFLAAYPSYHGRDFYITGESYAGVYIPFLVHELVKAPLPSITLRGFAIGNPFTDEVIDSNAQMDYDYTHGLISVESYTTLQTACKHTVLAQCLYYDKCNDACGRAIDVANAEANTSFLDPYYLNGDKCLLRDGQLSALQYRYVRPMHRGVIGPCQATFAAAYLSQASVQTAIHASSANVSAWTQCNNRVSSAYTRTFSALPKYPTILRAGLKALIYSGDADSVVNFIGTQRWLTSGGLNLSVEAKWHAWFGPDQQLAGYTEGYTNVTFTTIKGAGHMVPAVRPLHGLYLFECFLYGYDVCTTFTYPKDELENITGAAPDFFDEASVSNTALWLLLGAASIVAIAVGAAAWHRRTVHKKSAYVELKANGQPTQYGSDATP
ncbi:hypothetical protein SDRG_16032 [Saprolegnia diclina VS20]|uniref:Carboxypeptidase n=1 Tax=Saprolegnia diclina (strain VS20) TaxID=1156394 RepID=T0R9F3_SAPDV|nr:hypothetical protein SDRG_16032 [Saprolegnia diclina VS20]EQC26142.1 hypothetical protein SDRG_16032 [Saprolegnia diclina VS20]|eukprot:XP_008620444.1 hypothetical protein SDRG_16032 [Saprolegnia diclina VS20]